MQGVYRAVDTIPAVTTPKTLIYLTVPSDRVIEILSARISCQNEGTSEQIYAELNRVATVGAPAGTSITPKPTEELSAAAGTTALSNLTAEPTAYDPKTDAIYSGGDNKLAGWEYTPLPEERAIVKPGGAVGLRLINAITNASDLTAEIKFREIG